MAQLRRMAQMPAQYDPEQHRSGYTYTKEVLPGDHFEVFKKGNRELDPMTDLLCAGKKEEIGNYIQLCLGVTLVHIIIYKGASRKGIGILFKKLKHHVKKQPGTLTLAEFEKGVIYESAEFRRRTVLDMTTTIFKLLKNFTKKH